MRKEKSGSNGVQSAPALACGPISIGKLAIVLPMLLVYHSTIAAKADSCPVNGDEIATDRPDVTNSSVVARRKSANRERHQCQRARRRSISGWHKYALSRRNAASAQRDQRLGAGCRL